MPPTGARARIVQVHPSRRCNLRCAHCYSLSGPAERDLLEIAPLRQAIHDAAALGYNVASFSGGEPTLFHGLASLLEVAHESHMFTAAVTNGMTLTPARLALLRERLDLLAISLDGVPESHNRMRNSPRAFAAMASHLPALRDSGIRFGFIFTLTQSNLSELSWVADFAATQGAQLLQIHPLEEVGRASEALQGSEPDDMERALAWLTVAELRDEYTGQLDIQLDLIDAETLEFSPGAVFADDLDAALETYPLAELLSPLTIEADGIVSPLFYGFPRAFSLGNLLDAPLPLLAERWKASQCAAFRSVCRQVFDEQRHTGELPIFNWYRAIGETAAITAV